MAFRNPEFFHLTWVGRVVIVAIVLVAMGGRFSVQGHAQPVQRSVAILEIPEEGGTPDPLETYGVKYLVATAGIPHTVTTSVDVATSHAFVIATSGIDASTFSASQRSALRSYVNDGGVVLTGNFKDPNLYDLFGINGEDYDRGRHRINFHRFKLSDTFDWMDESKEQTISLGKTDRDQVALSRSYIAQDATVLARFDDGTPAFTRHQYGSGAAYLLGVSLRDVTIRNQMNRDFTAQRSFSNGFEPSGDVFPLLVRSLYREHVSHAVWKHTAPRENSSAVMITHDVDSESGMDWMNQFAAYEQAQGITATYNVTTHYIDDFLAGDYYTPYRDSISRLHDQSQRVGGHSVGHFPDFDTLPLGTLGNTQETYAPFYDGEQTSNGTLLGELEVSKGLLEEDVSQKVTSFRAGHLLYHDKLVNALDTLGYQFNSTYSANDVLTSFPYRNVKGRSFSGSISGVWEVPMTLSDVYADDPMTEENYSEKVDSWLNVYEKYAANGAPVVLLVHPNRGYKLDAEQDFVEQLSSDPAVLSIQAFGRFWQTRQATEIATEYTEDHLVIQLTNRMTLPDSLSLVVDDGADVETIALRNEDGHALAYQTTTRSDGRLIVHSTTPAGDVPVAEASAVVGSDGKMDFGATGLDIRFYGTDGEAVVSALKYDEGPESPSAIVETYVSEYRFVVTAGPPLAFDSTEVQMAVSTLSGIEDPEAVQVYRRETPGVGSFAPLETTVGSNGTPEVTTDDTLYVTTESFSEFVLASDSSPLPVELVDFDARMQKGAVHLDWRTAGETDNAGFRVQRRRGVSQGERGGDWSRIGRVEGGGTTSEARTYQFVDAEVPFAANQLTYRLKQVDTDGTTHLSEPVTIRRHSRSVELAGPAPNPARQRARIRFAVPERQSVQLHLYDVLGRRVRTLVQGARSGRHEVNLDVSGLSSGVYFLRLRAEGAVKTRRVTVVE